jgi:hypothetical protein
MKTTQRQPKNNPKTTQKQPKDNPKTTQKQPNGNEVEFLFILLAIAIGSRRRSVPMHGEKVCLG